MARNEFKASLGLQPNLQLELQDSQGYRETRLKTQKQKKQKHPTKKQKQTPVPTKENNSHTSTMVTKRHYLKF